MRTEDLAELGTDELHAQLIDAVRHLTPQHPVRVLWDRLDEVLKAGGAECLPGPWDFDDPHVRSFLDLSTEHLPPALRDRLGNYASAIRTEYGWWMYAPESAAMDPELHDWPAELLAIVGHARSRGCAYVLFDSDAAPSDDLPVFDEPSGVGTP
ncbi:DUF5983 family protein (plasmid) [Streptomyces sp. SDT5-1]|uniref:DUF5983 family protein n=1 Tax=Streptomyces sp. SDT5-1 TaxID=3406418 RepID=UPI003FD2215E